MIPSAPMDPRADTQTVVLEPTPGPVTVPPAVLPVQEGASGGTTAPPSEPGPEGRSAETKPGPFRQLWSHRWTKVALLCLAAAVAVVVIIWGLRSAHKSPSEGAPPATTAPPHHVVHTAPKTLVVPLPAAEVAKYQQYAAGFQTANATANHAIVAAGSAPTTAQLASPVTAYGTAVNLYDFQLRFITWPSPMQPAITVDHTQLEALVSFLKSFGYVTPSGVGTWLSELHTRAATAQAADNKIRRDLGLSSSSSFP